MKEWNADLNVIFKVAGAEMGVQGAAFERSWPEELDRKSYPDRFDHPF